MVVSSYIDFDKRNYFCSGCGVVILYRNFGDISEILKVVLSLCFIIFEVSFVFFFFLYYYLNCIYIRDFYRLEKYVDY